MYRKKGESTITHTQTKQTLCLLFEEGPEVDEKDIIGEDAIKAAIDFSNICLYSWER